MARAPHILPYEFTDTDQADTIHTYVTEVKKLADTMRSQIKDRNADLADGNRQGSPPILRKPACRHRPTRCPLTSISPRSTRPATISLRQRQSTKKPSPLTPTLPTPR